MKRKEEREWTREKRRRGKERADDLFLMAVRYDKGLMNNTLSNTKFLRKDTLVDEA